MFCVFLKLIFVPLCVTILDLHQSVYASTNWDILIFTQHWPITVCMQWKEAQEHHSCKFLPENTWTIHGIWPTKLGTIGPQFCNHSLHFDPQLLEPIKNDLLTYWPDIYNGSTTGLWKHEWTKHGTCAAILEPLNTEIKYFSKGIEWLQTYTMENILARAGINPDNMGYTPQQIWNAIKGSLDINPDVQCVKDKKTGRWYLFEIRICFDKSLKLIDCDGIKGLRNISNKILSNCPLTETLLYPGHMPSDEETHEDSKPYRLSWLFQFLQIIQLVQWITL